MNSLRSKQINTLHNDAGCSRSQCSIFTPVAVRSFSRSGHTGQARVLQARIFFTVKFRRRPLGCARVTGLLKHCNASQHIGLCICRRYKHYQNAPKWTPSGTTCITLVVRIGASYLGTVLRWFSVSTAAVDVPCLGRRARPRFFIETSCIWRRPHFKESRDEVAEIHVYEVMRKCSVNGSSKGS